MDNWLNTRAGIDLSMRTLPDMTKAMNRLADALLVQNDLKIDERQPVGIDWESDAKLLYTALSRMHQADNEDMEFSTEMAFDVLSSVSMDFRNEYATCKWQGEKN